jgi:hypothetical protein
MSRCMPAANGGPCTRTPRTFFPATKMYFMTLSIRFSSFLATYPSQSTLFTSPAILVEKSPVRGEGWGGVGSTWMHACSDGNIAHDAIHSWLTQPHCKQTCTMHLYGLVDQGNNNNK